MNEKNNIEIIVLGIAQDGGIPQAGCLCSHCQRARTDHTFRQLVASLAIADHRQQRFWLIDATPDLGEQLNLVHEILPAYQLAGILLTHAHFGHFAGLLLLGREVMDANKLVVHATARFCQLLQRNAPWSQLVEQQNILLHTITPEKSFMLAPTLRVTPIPVPHRDEHSDTMAFLLQGMSQSIFYCPDIDSWSSWDRDPRTFFSAMDLALIDGTFFSDNELSTRDLAEVPHPFVTDTVRRLSGIRCDIRFIHLNHTNPLLDRGNDYRWLIARGFQIAQPGDRWFP